MKLSDYQQMPTVVAGASHLGKNKEKGRIYHAGDRPGGN